MVIASLMMMSPMIVWGRKREEEDPHQYMVHTCTPRDSTTTTDSGRNGGEQEGYEMVSKCQLSVLLLDGKRATKERSSFFHLLALVVRTQCSASLHAFCTQLPQTHTPTLALRSEAMTHENHPYTKGHTFVDRKDNCREKVSSP